MSALSPKYYAGNLGLQDVREHDRRIALQPRQLRPLHRRLPERRAERVLIERKDVRRQRHRIASPR